jgi:hypothetical protein
LKEEWAHIAVEDLEDQEYHLLEHQQELENLKAEKSQLEGIYVFFI